MKNTALWARAFGRQAFGLAFALVFALAGGGCVKAIGADIAVTDTAVRLTGLIADGSDTAETTLLTLTFDRPVPGFAAENITLTDAEGTNIQLGALTAVTPVVYTLGVLNVGADGFVTVTLTKEGVVFAPNARKVQVYDEPETGVAFLSLTTDGSDKAMTTELRLKFIRDILELTADDITLDDPDGTGVQKGELTDSGGGAYTLAVSGIAKPGTVGVTVQKEGYAFKPGSVKVYWVTGAPDFLSLEADGSDSVTTALTLTFSEAIAGLSADDITLDDPDGTGIRVAAGSGALTAGAAGTHGEAVYMLAVSGVNKSGTVKVSVAKAGYTITPAELTATVHWSPDSAEFLSLAADGGDVAATARLTLTFSETVAGLSADDITLDDPDGTGITKGALTQAPVYGVYTLAVNSIAKNGTVKVSVAKTGCLFAPSFRTAEVYGPPNTARFVSLTADGGAAVTTTALTLTFDKPVTGLSADDITLTDTDGTGIQKGALTQTPVYAVYALAVNSIAKNGTVTLRVQKKGYVFESASQPASLHYAETLPPFTLTADGGATTTTTALTLAFDKAVTGLTAGDITLIDTDGTGIIRRAFQKNADGSFYTLSVSGVAKTGNVRITVRPAGYTRGAKDVKVFRSTAPTVVEFQSVMGNGSDSAVTTALTLVFNKAIAGLSADDITLTDPDGTGITKGALTETASYGVYTLAVSGIYNHGGVSVQAAKAGYDLKSRTLTAQVHAPPDMLRFASLEANGVRVGPDWKPTEELLPTTRLRMWFTRYPWSESYILLEDPGNTGIKADGTANERAGAGGLVCWELAVKNITRSGTAQVSMVHNATGKKTTRTVQVHGQPVEFLSLGPLGTLAAWSTSALTFTLSREVPELEASDLRLIDTDGTGIELRGGDALRYQGDGVYHIAANMRLKGGNITVRIVKAGYTFVPAERTMLVVLSPLDTAEFLSLEAPANPSPRSAAQLTLKFSNPVPWVSAKDIKLTSGTGTKLTGAGLTHMSIPCP